VTLTPQAIRVLKTIVFVVALVPLARLAAGVFLFPEWLGANPAEFITRSTGDWTLRFLLITLAVTPLRKLFGWHALASFRRMLGLYAFFYGLVHLSSYVAFDHVFDVMEILKDIVKRPFITVGFTALVLLLPLAVTSTNRMVQRLGAKRWLALHRLVYVIAPLGVLHFWWMVKRDVTEPAIYAAILAALLGYRVWTKVKDQRRRARPARGPAVAPRPNA
jgi:sulfoxide reductase heme-binding subunit YedZ